MQNGDEYMLLEFRASNYKSFKDEMVFSLIPVKNQKGLSYSILKETVHKKTYKGLCSAVIYGPNAAGKTNIIGAMDTFKSIVLRGNLKNAELRSSPNTASSMLELIPNNLLENALPVTFSIKFITNGVVIEYGFSADIGKFLEVDYPRKILSESLYVNESLVFSRKEKLEFGSFKDIKGFLINAFSQNQESAIELARNNLNNEELFLMNGFKNMFSSKLVTLISEWLTRQFLVIYRSDMMYMIRQSKDQEKNSIYIENILNEAAKCLGINSNALGYVTDNESNEAKLCSVFGEVGKKRTAIPAELFESYGTIRFVNLFPLIANVLISGGTLVVDEFDASIHPMVLMSIVNIFHNDEINKNKAQLIFNTHNPIFLNSNLYRQDEIKFVERDDVSHCSTHYSLSDFNEPGKRKSEDYMSNYFVSRYGAIKDIDFSPFFEKLLNKNNEVKSK